MSPSSPEPLYVYFLDGYEGPVVTTEVRPGLLFDTTPDNRLIGIEVLDYVRVTGAALPVSPTETRVLSNYTGEGTAIANPDGTLTLRLPVSPTDGLDVELRVFREPEGFGYHLPDCAITAEDNCTCDLYDRLDAIVLAASGGHP